jgi:hypothetical protein
MARRVELEARWAAWIRSESAEVVLCMKLAIYLDSMGGIFPALPQSQNQLRLTVGLAGGVLLLVAAINSGRLNVEVVSVCSLSGDRCDGDAEDRGGVKDERRGDSSRVESRPCVLRILAITAKSLSVYGGVGAGRLRASLRRSRLT